MKIIDLIDLIQEYYSRSKFVPLHAPVLRGNEKKFINHAVDSSYVSSVGKYVNLLKDTNEKGINTGPIWTLMNKLSIYSECKKVV